MKLNNFTISVILFCILLSVTSSAQEQNKPRASLKAGVSQVIGVDTEVKIAYSRPGVKGRKIWGEVVPYGLVKNDEGKLLPWRGGANEKTTIEFNKDVMIENNKLAAGKYGLHFIPDEKEWTVIFSKNSGGWGAYDYSEDQDALRIKVKPVDSPHQEWLQYGFEDLAGTSATAFLQWEKVKIPFKLTTAQ